MALLGLLALAAILIWLVGQQLIEIKSEPPSSRSKQNLHGISLALERYAADHGSYPANFQSVVSELYMPKLPENPYLRKYKRRMQWLIPGTPHSPGDFIYYPYEAEFQGQYHSYDLVLYGRDGTNGWPLPDTLTPLSEPRFVIYLIRQASLRGAPQAIRYGEDE